LTVSTKKCGFKISWF